MSQPHPLSVECIRTPPWQIALRDAIRSVQELLDLLNLSAADVGGIQPESTGFPMLVPQGFAARMKTGDPHDPLLRQVLPSAQELRTAEGFSADPLEERALAEDGILKKYHGRALLIATGACPVHCRYCFRRHFPYETQLASRGHWIAALEYLKRTKAIKEVILSGGDPLSLSNNRLSTLLNELAAIDSLDILRLHTRFPIVLPERIDNEFVALLAATRLRTVVVVHCNHPNEIDDGVVEALQALRSAGCVVLNQSVLLRDINDNASALVALSERLFEAGVLPYYLHLLDPVTGAAHYEVGEERGQALMAAIRKRLPGYLVPRLVREVPGELSKTMIA